MYQNFRKSFINPPSTLPLLNPSIPLPKAKFIIQIPDAHAAGLGDDAQETGPDVADLVVLV